MVCARYAHAIFTVRIRKCVVYPNGMPAEDPCNNSEYLAWKKTADLLTTTRSLLQPRCTYGETAC